MPVADGIRKPEVLLGKILQGEAPVYGEGKDVEMADGREEVRGRGKKVYRDLMNGVSHMLPFVIGGGILNHFVNERRKMDYTGKRKTR